MGKFGASFSRELGKNTGKWVSNKVFGDGHATPHRIIRTGERKAAINKETEEVKLKTAQVQADKEVEILETQLEFEKEIRLDNKLSSIHTLTLPRDSASLVNLGSQLVSMANSTITDAPSNFFEFKTLSDEDSSISSACVEKLEDVIHLLRSNGDHDNSRYFERKLSRIEEKRNKVKAVGKKRINIYIVWLGVSVSLGSLMIYGIWKLITSIF